MLNICEEKILDCWFKNAKPWIKAIQNNEIESRVLTTNSAIIKCILNESPEYVFDIGCGEGWLVRSLSNQGIHSVGIDAIPELITAAKAQSRDKSKETYRVLSYKDISQYEINETFDVIVCNFSLLGKNSVNQLLKKIPYFLNQNGVFIVHTIHPLLTTAEPYEDGWRKGSWSGFSHHFTDPAPWYFRTLENWNNLFNANNLTVTETIDSKNPITDDLESIIFKCCHIQT